jgi:hypothetical protein
MIAAYLVLVEVAKSRFYASQDRPHGAPISGRERLERRIARRAAWFTHHHHLRRPKS